MCIFYYLCFVLYVLCALSVFLFMFFFLQLLLFDGLSTLTLGLLHHPPEHWPGMVFFWSGEKGS